MKFSEVLSQCALAPDLERYLEVSGLEPDSWEESLLTVNPFKYKS